MILLCFKVGALSGAEICGGTWSSQEYANPNPFCQSWTIELYIHNLEQRSPLWVCLVPVLTQLPSRSILHDSHDSHDSRKPQEGRSF